MTPTTMSSLIPSVSIFRINGASPGEGGGVCSAAVLRLGDFGDGLSALDNAFNLGDEAGERGSLSSCDLLTRFVGGCESVSVVGVDLEFER